MTMNTSNTGVPISAIIRVFKFIFSFSPLCRKNFLATIALKGQKTISNKNDYL